MEHLTTLTLAKQYQKFSAAHFTIFSATERERLHGHNFTVEVDLTAPVGNNGICFSYRIYKDIIKKICLDLDEYLLLPGNSPHLGIDAGDDDYIVDFNGQKMAFLKADTRILPIRNTTVEEFSDYILQQLLSLNASNNQFDLRALEVRVFSGPGQSGSARWCAEA